MINTNAKIYIAIGLGEVAGEVKNLTVNLITWVSFQWLHRDSDNPTKVIQDYWIQVIFSYIEIKFKHILLSVGVSVKSPIVTIISTKTSQPAVQTLLVQS